MTEQRETVVSKDDSNEYIESSAEAQGSGYSYMCVLASLLINFFFIAYVSQADGFILKILVF